VAEFIKIELKRAAVALAMTREYVNAAQSQGISENELRQRISTLEDILCVHLFQRSVEPPMPTEDGFILIQEMRHFLARLDQTEPDQQAEDFE
jgi:DNA-binding transcriptional LysR family regulator